MFSPDLTIVIINYRTIDLTRRAIDSVRKYYPAIPLLLIDNGSADGSAEVMEEVQRARPECTRVILNPGNLHHGPAMDQALHHLHSRHVLFLDSDCTITRGGIVEGLFEAATATPGAYAAGKKIFMNDRGFDVAEQAGAHPYIRPICMLIDREQYLLLPSFERHGAPCLRNMIAAHEQGLRLAHFPVEDFVRHDGRGTAKRHGYALGWRGKINHLLNRLGI